MMSNRQKAKALGVVGIITALAAMTITGVTGATEPEMPFVVLLGISFACGIASLLTPID